MNLEPLEELTEEEAKLLIRAVDRAIEESPEKLDHYAELLVTIAARDALIEENNRLREALEYVVKTYDQGESLYVADVVAAARAALTDDLG